MDVEITLSYNVMTLVRDTEYNNVRRLISSYIQDTTHMLNMFKPLVELFHHHQIVHEVILLNDFAIQ
jgi:hypothetical protein